MAQKFAVGDRVRMTRAFLRSTGQFKGSDANGRWTVQACECRNCREGSHVLTDQRSSWPYTAEEVEREPWLLWRHINAENLERIN